MDLVGVLKQQCFALACLLREEVLLQNTAPFFNDDTMPLNITRIGGKTMRLPINLISLQYKACKKCYPSPLEFKIDFHSIFKRYFEIADRTETHYWEVIAIENRYVFMLASIESEFRLLYPSYRVSNTYQEFEINFDMLDDELKVYIDRDDTAAVQLQPKYRAPASQLITWLPQYGNGELQEPLNLVLSEEQRAKRKRAEQSARDASARNVSALNIKREGGGDLQCEQHSAKRACVEKGALKQETDTGLVKKEQQVVNAAEGADSKSDMWFSKFPPGCVIDAEIATTSKGFLSGQYRAELDKELMGGSNNDLPLNLSKLKYNEIDDSISTDYDTDFDDDDNHNACDETSEDPDTDYDDYYHFLC